MEEILKTTEDKKVHLAFIFDPNKCIICNACVNACNSAYGGLNWRTLLVFGEDTKVGVSISCNHCENPLCMKACPANAIRRDELGIVYIDPKECIGCGYCTWACPYEEPKFTKEGIMSKCDFCRARLLNKQGLPLCVESCPTGALSFGWVKEKEYSAPYLAPYDITRPNLVVRQSKTEIKASPLKQRKEQNYWQLLLFTLFSEFALGSLFVPVKGVIPLILMLVGLVPSILHINRKDRFYRVIFNLKTSWLSREVFFASLSVLSLILYALTDTSVTLISSVTLVSLAVLSSIMLYLLKSVPSWYNLDTPISFVGTAFTTTFPIGYFLTHDPVYLVVGVVFSVAEMVVNKENKYRISLNSAYVVLAILSILFPLISLITVPVAVLSEFIQRKGFYEHILYYGLPK
ncbi:DmsC/YnfH family molybdoenzyme membrane anchor subunit [Stygiolobus caldivivus]|uniref:4Fe-4S ferredoxin n=1 Tax=Stygiolobus caldivivus TaxID=2824673 RepID=A0A8D5U8Z1_9CREN|nr:DmsC/YnfH family molybdoenzyme membrane anchor subunit [Stygiolobus caldivivus]BCU71568.1 4Fe-4S ferredoxin [Stygiolobus caldivivus]